jgi:hypothetical protein
MAGGTSLVELLLMAKMSPMLPGTVGVVKVGTTSLVDGVESSWARAVKVTAGIT